MTRDQFLCEMMGKCWHNFLGHINHPEDMRCAKCGEVGFEYNPDYKNPADILALQQWVMDDTQHEGFKWCEFEFFAWKKWRRSTDCEYIKWLFFSPDRLATLIAEFGGWKGEVI